MSDSRSEQSRYPQWKIDLFREGLAERHRRSRRDPDPGVIRYFPRHIFDDPAAAEGRSIVENDAIQAEHRETRP